MAKVDGNYQHLTAGDPSEATRALTGAPSFNMVHNTTSNDKLWKALVLHDTNDELMFLNTPNDG